jgi:uncharacterized alpha-E superfamily protein
MISRVAESCFWLQRYMERADNTARIIGVSLAHLLDASPNDPETWRPILIAAGEAPRFREQYGQAGELDGELVQRYLTWDEDNLASIFSSVHAARENARTIRESISQETWECLNLLWLWLEDPASSRLYRRERSEFYGELLRRIQTFRGTVPDTMLHEEPLDFMRLGVQLERAGMIARILDVRHHMLVGAGEDEGSPVDFARLHGILRSCGGIEAFLKRGRSFSGTELASFVVRDRAFPRSILHCLERAANALDRILEPDAREVASLPSRRSPALVASARKYLTELERDELRGTRVHGVLTQVVERVAAICDAVHTDFFAPDETPVANSEVRQ